MIILMVDVSGNLIIFASQYMDLVTYFPRKAYIIMTKKNPFKFLFTKSFQPLFIINMPQMKENPFGFIFAK